MAILEPKCESCGKVDEFAKKRLLQTGKLHYGDQPEVRSPLLCDRCRAALFALLQSTLELDPAEPASPETTAAN